VGNDPGWCRNAAWRDRERDHTRRDDERGGKGQVSVAKPRKAAIRSAAAAKEDQARSYEAMEYGEAS
jgi:hypothetical protein